MSSLALSSHSCRCSHIIGWPHKHSDERTGGINMGAIYYRCIEEFVLLRLYSSSDFSPPLLSPPFGFPPPTCPSPHSSLSGWKVQWGCGIPEGQWGGEGGGGLPRFVCKQGSSYQPVIPVSEKWKICLECSFSLSTVRIDVFVATLEASFCCYCYSVHTHSAVRPEP